MRLARWFDVLRVPALVLLSITLIAAGVAGCSPANRPDSQQAFESQVVKFYASALAGPDPYQQYRQFGGENLIPFWALLPLDNPSLTAAEIRQFSSPLAGNRDHQAWANVTIGSGDQVITYLEETTWRYNNGAWELRSVAGRDILMTSWAGAIQRTGGGGQGVATGLVAWEHGRSVWVLDSASGSLQRLVEPEQAASTVPGLYVDSWSPDGTVLLLYSEDAAYFWRPHDAAGSAYELTMLCKLGNYGGGTWSPDGRYVSLDAGTDVVRSAEIVEVSTGKLVWIHDVATDRRLGGIGVTYGVHWAPDSEALYCSVPVAVDPPLAAGDGSSSSLAVLRLVDGVLQLEILETGTSERMYSFGGFGRDGSVLYTSGAVGPGGLPQGGATWYRWDPVARQGVRLAGAGRPEMAAPEAPPKIQVPSALRGPEAPYILEARVGISPEGRWGVFSVPGGGPDQGFGVYLIDLTAPATYVRVAAGSSVYWQPLR